MNKTVILVTLLMVMILNIPAFAVVSDSSTQPSSDQPSEETNTEEKIITSNQDSESSKNLDDNDPQLQGPESTQAINFEPNSGVADPDLQISSSLLDWDMNNISTMMWDESTFDYKIEVYNNGPENATGVNVKINMSKADFENIDFDIDPAFDPETGLWTIGNLSVGKVATLILEFKALNLGIFDFISEVTGDGVDNILENNIAKNTLNVSTTGDPDLEIVSWFGDLNGELPSLTVGQIINYGIIVYYENTPLNATGVVVDTGINKTEVAIKSWKTVKRVTDEATEMDPAFDPETCIWTIGNLSDEWEGAILLVELEILKPGTLVFVSKVTGDGVDPFLENNVYTATSLAETPEASGGGDEYGTDVNDGTTTVSAQEVGLQDTGMPLAALVLAILMVLAGTIVSRKK